MGQVFVWIGNNHIIHAGGLTADLSGVSGATFGDADHVTIYNQWNYAPNWVQRVPAGSTGNTGGGGTGGANDDQFYYLPASRWPREGDHAIFKHLFSYDGSNGLSAWHHYPKSELLFGGVSGPNSVWNSAVPSSTGDIKITVEQSYFDASLGTGDNWNSRYGPHRKIRSNGNPDGARTYSKFKNEMGNR